MNLNIKRTFELECKKEKKKTLLETKIIKATIIGLYLGIMNGPMSRLQFGPHGWLSKSDMNSYISSCHFWRAIYCISDNSYNICNIHL